MKVVNWSGLPFPQLVAHARVNGFPDAYLKTATRGDLIAFLTARALDPVDPNMYDDNMHEQILLLISSGAMDSRIREIAKACINRKHIIDGYSPRDDEDESEDAAALRLKAEDAVRNYLDANDPYSRMPVNYKIPAIKMYRDISKAGLRESKQAVERIIDDMEHVREVLRSRPLPW